MKDDDFILYMRGAAGALNSGLCGTCNTDLSVLAQESSHLIKSYSDFTGNLSTLLLFLFLFFLFFAKRFHFVLYHRHPLFSLPSGMRKSPDVSPRRLSDISPQLRQLKYLVVDEAIKEDLKSSRSVEDINSASIEERILRITGYYGYQPWSASYKSESSNVATVYMHGVVKECSGLYAVANERSSSLNSWPMQPGLGA